MKVLLCIVARLTQVLFYAWIWLEQPTVNDEDTRRTCVHQAHIKHGRVGNATLSKNRWCHGRGRREGTLRKQ